MKASQIENNKVLPSPQKKLSQSFKRAENEGERARLTLRDLASLREYKDFYGVVERQKLKDIKRQYSNGNFGWLEDP